MLKICASSIKNSEYKEYIKINYGSIVNGNFEDNIKIILQ